MSAIFMLALLPRCGLAQQTRAQMEPSETLFSVAATLNTCGYDAGLESSLPIRQQVRAELSRVLAASPQAAREQALVCEFWRDHATPANPDDVSPYVSLTLDVGTAPDFNLLVPAADLAPDAGEVQGFLPLLRRFYKAADLHKIWSKHQEEYEKLIAEFHDPMAAVITQTDTYLRIPFGVSSGRRFVVFVEPMLSPAQVHSRNYSDSYYVVVSPDRGNSREGLHLLQVRHTYLHYILDPLAASHQISMKKLEPLLPSISSAPLSRSFKENASQLVNECLVRAIEIRMQTKVSPQEKAARAQRSAEEGFVLTPYFQEELQQFEKSPRGLLDSYGDLLFNIDVAHERKLASQIRFAREATPEIMTPLVAVRAESPLDTAEQRLVAGDPESAQRIAATVLQDTNKTREWGRAYFVLARAATLSNDMQGARTNFQKALETAQDPRTVAWSHIYLGRILDLQEQRDAAKEQYRAALQAGDPNSDTRVAAEQGLSTPYQPPKGSK